MGSVFRDGCDLSRGFVGQVERSLLAAARQQAGCAEHDDHEDQQQVRGAQAHDGLREWDGPIIPHAPPPSGTLHNQDNREHRSPGLPMTLELLSLLLLFAGLGLFGIGLRRRRR